jgi:hypothetical protein
MSWREVLGADGSMSAPHTHNSHNPHKSTPRGNCEDIGNYGYGVSKLFEALATACTDLPITPAELQAELAPEDITDIEAGRIGPATVRAFAEALLVSRQRERGEVPAHYVHRATCRGCGPVWLFAPGEVAGCPWCWNRAKGLSIPPPNTDGGEE